MYYESMLRGEEAEKKVISYTKQTTLSKYTYHQLGLKTPERNIIPDHIIFLPHKIVIIETKHKNGDIRVFNHYDAIKSPKFETHMIFGSLVEQIDYYKTNIETMPKEGVEEISISLSDAISLVKRESIEDITTLQDIHLKDVPFKIEVVCFIDTLNAEIQTYQTKVTLMTEEMLQQYLNLLEQELRFYPQELIEALFVRRFSTLMQHSTDLNIGYKEDGEGRVFVFEEHLPLTTDDNPNEYTMNYTDVDSLTKPSN